MTKAEMIEFIVKFFADNKRALLEAGVSESIFLYEPTEEFDWHHASHRGIEKVYDLLVRLSEPNGAMTVLNETLKLVTQARWDSYDAFGGMESLREMRMRRDARVNLRGLLMCKRRPWLLKKGERDGWWQKRQKRLAEKGEVQGQGDLDGVPSSETEA